MKVSTRIAAALATVILGASCLLTCHFAIAANPKDTPVTPGELLILKRGGKPGGACPLKHTDVDAQISGFIARVNVIQEFTNPTSERIEAVYTFPLPQDSAVDRMEMKVGGRTIVGEIHRREEARQIYQAAREAGHVASLLDQERPNIFTQSVANIMPGAKVQIKISYTQILSYEAGDYKFVFPMVVGPRYIPGSPTGKQGTGSAPDTTQVPDASKITPPITPKGTRAGHDVSLSVKIDAGVPIYSATSELHEADYEFPDETTATVTLKDKATIPNRDFVLKYSVAGEMVGSGVITHASGSGGGFFTLIFQPPKAAKPQSVTPKEMIFVIDTSGSQQGEPLAKSKETMLHCIKNVNPGDTFNMISFSNGVQKLFDSPQPYDQKSLDAALDFLKKCEASGGTEMLPAIKAALDPAADPKRLRVVVFFTDGYVGNDFEILDCVRKSSGRARVFPFGIGNGVNRFLIERMGELGRGTSEVVLLSSDSKQIAEKFYGRIRNPLITDIAIDWNGLPVAVDDVYPKQTPDLFSAQPLILKGRYTGPASGEIIVRGRVAGEPWVRKISVDFPASQSDNDSLASIWARAKVDDLMDTDLMGAQNGSPKPEIQEQITNVALEYHLMTQYTSFVAVETMVVTSGGVPKTIAVPVEMPDGVSYEGVRAEDKAVSPAGRLRFAAASPASTGGAWYYSTKGGAAIAGRPMRAAKPASPASAAPASSGYRVWEDGSFDVDTSIVTRGDEKDIEKFKQQAQLAQKLDKSLVDLLGKYDKSGKSGNYSIPGKLVVKNGKVEVLIWVTDATKAKMAKLDKLGLWGRSWAIPSKVLIGWVPLAKLKEMALMEPVERITAPTYIKK